MMMATVLPVAVAATTLLGHAVGDGSNIITTGSRSPLAALLRAQETTLPLVAQEAVGPTTLPPASASHSPPFNGSSFVQPHFVISMFIEPQWSPRNYARIKQANFTTVLHEHGCCLGSVNGTTVVNTTARNDSIRWCEQHGLDVIIKYNEVFGGSNIRGASEFGSDSPAVLGLNLKDEPIPTSTELSILRKMQAKVRALLPGRLSFINMGGSIYDHPDLVEEYVQTVQPDVLCFDRYPSFEHEMTPPPQTVMRPVNDTYNESGVWRNSRDGYLHALSTVRAAALKHRLPLWNYFKSSGVYESVVKDAHGINPAPTESEMRWQMFTSLAYGARGLLWFYYTPENRSDRGIPTWAGLVSDDTLDNYPTERWWQAQRLNSAVLALGPTLMQLRSTSVVALRLSDEAEPGDLLAAGHSVIRNISRGSFTVGSFVFEDGRGEAVLLQNYAWTYTQTPTVDFGLPLTAGPHGGAPVPMEVDQHSGELIPIQDEILNLPGIQIGLVAGGGRLFVIETNGGWL